MSANWLRRATPFAACLSVFIGAYDAQAEDMSYAKDDPWSVSLYVGPATTKYFIAFVQSLNMHPTNVMAGVKVDRRLLYLGADVWIGAEAEGSIYRFGHPDETYGAGLGFIFNAPFGMRHASLSVYDGPSWSTDPPYTSIGYHDKVWPAWRDRFLNYIGVEYAIDLSRTGKWDAVVDLYHRSGMFGVYSEGDDDGFALGAGVRYRF